MSTSTPAWPLDATRPTAERLRAATEALGAALGAHDLELCARVADETADLSPKLLAEQAAPAELETLVRPWIEAWDDVLTRWWFAPDGEPELRRALLVPTGGAFAHRRFLLMAFWLRACGSERVGRVDEPRLAGRTLDEQACALGRFVVRADGAVAVDYARLHAELAPELRAALAFWALGVHLMSPLAQVDEAVRANRAALSRDFARVHARADLGLAADLLLSQSGYRSVYLDPDPLPFLRTLSERVLAPAFGRLVGPAARAIAGTGGIGVWLGCWNEHHAVRRSVGPLLEGIRAAGPVGFWPTHDLATAEARLGPEWSRPPVRLAAVTAQSPSELAALAREIRARDLDLLFYPEVSLTNGSRWLSTQRLARVQATTYGHPVTTGSAAMDYFVGGELLEDGSARYRERLILLPGLGHSTTVPPPPSRARRRPVEQGPCRFASLSSHDKLNGGVLSTWDALLGGAPRGSELELFPGLDAARTRELASAIDGRVTAGRVTLTPKIDRIECLNRLQEADVGLDAFPYTGFNSTIDALSVGVPVVTLAGRGPYGQTSAAALRLLGIDAHTVARDPDEYVRLALRLAHDPGLRRELRARLTRDRLVRAVADPDLGAHFAAAVEWMRRTGPSRPGPPVVIRAGEPPRLLDAWPRRPARGGA